MINNENFITIQGFMVNELELKGNELIIYAIIYGFSQDGENRFTGSLNYLASWCKSTKQGVIKNLKSLIDKGYIVKEEKFINRIKFCEYYSTKFNGGIKHSLTGGIKLSLPNNIDNNNIDNIIDSSSSSSKQKHKYGEYKNVLLTKEEHTKLLNEHGDTTTAALIKYLDEYIEMKGYKAKSHYLCIKKWVVDAYKRNKDSISRQEMDEKIANGEEPF